MGSSLSQVRPSNPVTGAWGGVYYRGASLIRNTPPPRTLLKVLWWSSGGGPVSYERGTPVVAGFSVARRRKRERCVPRKALGGVISKVNFNQVCQLLTTISRKMAPRTRQSEAGITPRRAFCGASALRAT